jgi:hypothetical protein
MKLQDFLGKETKFGMEAIASDEELARQIQIRLIALGLLDPPSDGKFGPISTTALKRFQDLMKCGEPEFLGQATAKKLIETKTEDVPKPAIDLSLNDFAARIIKYMQAKNYYFATGNREFNIIYVEGMDGDGNLNDDAPNEFNDRRIVLEFVNGVPKIVGNWEATTEPGYYYTFNPMNSKGAARIKFGQYKAWRMGMHGRAERHRALVQVEPISVHRDFNQNFNRVGDFVDTGIFAINQHWGFDFPRNDVNVASAGCLVGRTTQGHKEFLDVIEQDRRYLATPFGSPIVPGDPHERTYVFASTIIAGDELVKLFPA